MLVGLVGLIVIIILLNYAVTDFMAVEYVCMYVCMYVNATAMTLSLVSILMIIILLYYVGPNDELLLEAVRKFEGKGPLGGILWSEVIKHMGGGMSESSCRNRWNIIRPMDRNRNVSGANRWTGRYSIYYCNIIIKCSN